MNDIQTKLFEIFIEFDRVCAELNIKYFAIGGTALGAKRHQGFIPWDDDMDFGMIRSDYNRFLNEAPKLMKNTLFIQTHETDQYWYSPFMKIRDSETTAIEHIYRNLNINHGLWIDIFPIDKVPNNRFSLFIQSVFQTLCLRRFAAIEYRENKTFKRTFVNLLMRILMPSKELTYRFLNRITTKYNNNTKYTFSSIPLYHLPKSKCIYPISLTDSISRVKFESSNIPVFTNIVEYLKIKYGDWTVIPEINERKSGHTILYLDLKKPYYFPIFLKGAVKYDKK